MNPRTLTHAHSRAYACAHTHRHTRELRFSADTRGWSGQAELDRCLPCYPGGCSKGERLLANNTAVHSWPEISGPKHPRHVPASVSHPCGFHPPAAPSRRSPRHRRRQFRHLGQGPATLPSILHLPLQGPQARCGPQFPLRDIRTGKRPDPYSC